MRHITDDIRALYPSPRSGSYGGGLTMPLHPYQPGEYCVGGAFCLYTQYFPNPTPLDSFPGRFDLAEALMAQNPHLTEERALLYAEYVITANDLERFDEAWEFLDLALCHGQ